MFSIKYLVKSLDRDGFKYLNKDFDSKVLDLVKQKGFYHYGFMSGFETFEDESPKNRTFYS